MYGLGAGTIDSPYRSDPSGGGSYEVVVERRDETGEWNDVHRQSVYGANAEDACWTTLAHHWPVSVYDKSDWSVKEAAGRRELAGQGEVLRFTVRPGRYAAGTDTATLTLGQMLTAAAVHAAGQRVTAREALKEAREALQRARDTDRSAQYRAESAVTATTRAGVPEAQVKAAMRATTRTPRKAAGRRAAHG